jgi:predicted enzyme related to lactoylglutathione lyase
VVVGIGGVFIYSDDVARLARWYSDVLGITANIEGDATSFMHDFEVREAEGEGRLTHCVWSIFPADEEHPASPRSFTINYRVKDIDAVLAGAESKGATVVRREDSEYGRFAWLVDPDGREVELYEDVEAG